MNKLHSIFTSLILLTVCIATFPQSEPQDIFKSSAPCVVVIKTDLAMGSGFLLSSDGLIATNAHVIKDAKAVSIKLHNGDTFSKVWKVYEDELKDFAIIRIEGFELPACWLGNSDELEVGQAVVAIGNPEGLEFSITEGLISALRSKLNDVELGYRVIQTSTPISHGSSGGPLFTLNGKVIGLTTFKLIDGESLNFAVPINYLRGALNALDDESKIGEIFKELRWEGPSSAKSIISFRDLEWGASKQVVETSLTVKLKNSKNPPEVFEELKSLKTFSVFRFKDSILEKPLTIYLWFDGEGLASISFSHKECFKEIKEFISSIEDALIHNYGQPDSYKSDSIEISESWVDESGTICHLQILPTPCGFWEARMDICYDCPTITVIYARSDIYEVAEAEYRKSVSPL